MTEKYQPIPHRLKNMAVGGHVAGAEDIDAGNGKTQQDINADTYRKDETYSKEQLNNMITTPEQKYENYTAEDGDTFSDLGLPAEGEADTTYRVGSWDGTEYNASKFSEYSWDGTQYILLSVQSPGIDDEPDFLSSNLVESKGVKTLDYKIKNIIVDTTNTHTDAQIALDRAFIESIKKFVVYNPNKSNDTVFLRLFGYYTGTTNKIQLTITYDKSTFVDLTIPATSKPTGLQEHVFENNGIQAMLIFDWDLFGEYDEYNTQRYAISTVDTQDIPDFATLRPIEKLQNINLSNSSFETGLDEIPSTDTGKYLLDCIKNIKFFDGNGEIGDKYYLRVFGIFDSTFSPSITTPYIQFSAWDGANGGSIVDFRKTYDSSTDTGLKTYSLSSDCARLELTVDWDLYTNYFHSTSNPISFENKYFEENDTTASMELCGHLLNAPAYSKRFPSGISCPVKAASYDCQVVTMRIESKLTGKLSIYVGSYDQNLLFIPREEHQIDVVEGTQEIDLSERNIFLIKGETIAADTSFLGWAQGAAVGSAGDDSDSYYYTNRSASMWQLECHPSRAVYGSFYYDVLTSKTVRALAKTSFLERENDILKEELDKVETIASNANIVTDSSGNKYKLKVVNGDVVPVALTIKHVMVVGNSITIHPTNTDTDPDYATNIWWGHWSMAASCKEVSWPKLLEDVLKVRDEESSVTPVFGRRYELRNFTPSTPNTFTYWDDDQWKDLSANIGRFSNTDCVIFYLGHNYSGDDWETKYQAMIDQFKTWFPSAWMVCVAAYSSKTAVNNAIYNVATKEGFEYITPITMVKNKVGAYVSDDDGTLHQIGNTAVAGHPGDYGEYVILDRMCRTSTLSLTNNTPLYSVNLESEEGITLSTVTNQVLYKSIVSVFVTVSNDAEFEGLVVEDDGGNTISVTDQGSTTYGRVFTFEMPADNVTVSVAESEE